MSLPQKRITHPYIVMTRNVCGGRARIEGTRIPVWMIVERAYKLGESPEEMLDAWPHLNLAQIHDALSYYFDNRGEIEQDILDNSEEKLGKAHPEFSPKNA